MSIEILEHSTWVRVSWNKVVPAFRLGRIRFGADAVKSEVTDVIRLYPRSFGFDPAKVHPQDVITAGFSAGYECCPDQVIDEIIARANSRRKGYIVVPMDAVTRRTLLVWDNGKISEAESMVPGIVEQSQHWSVIMARP